MKSHLGTKGANIKTTYNMGHQNKGGPPNRMKDKSPGQNGLYGDNMLD